MAGNGNERLLRIDGKQVELGMYIHALHCSWLENPFWRKSFLLTEADDRDRVRQSVPSVTIDLSKGRGLTLTKARRSPLAEPPPPAADPPEPIPGPRRRHTRRKLTELELAGATADRAAQAVAKLFDEARLGQAIHAEDLVPMVDEMAEATLRDAAAMVTVTRLKDTDRYTYIHSVAVGALMMGLCRQLGYEEADVRVAGLAGLLHDIGKMYVPQHIVEKPGRLEPAELSTMRQHPALGHQLLRGMENLDPRILDVCRHHHEKLDGTGYPDNLAGDALSTFARISAVCDVYDAVTSIRSYKRAWSPHEALAQMEQWRGHFDADILRSFITSLGIQPFGALVRLHSNRLGVVAADGDTPTSPIVRVFFDVPDQREIAVEDVASSADPIIRVERGDYWFGDRWETLRSALMNPARTAGAPGGVRFQEAQP